MNRTPEQQWSALSALYEEADGLRADELKAWLERLEREGNPLLPQLKLMLDARSHLETDDFLGTLPKLSADAANASDWHEGDRVGPYRLVKPLGEGGMAEVWLAERADGAFKRQVAIKLPYPRPGRETFAARFDRERDILATLRHPHIAGLFDAGVTKEGQAWLALEYVEGQPISTFCDERKLPVRERVQLFRQVLLAVQHAHANLVIHRDLKPGNILVTSQGEVRLLDFGIAKLLEAQGDAIEETELTRQAGRSMTPRYASPEQLMGLPLTTACDVYSLGVVFYELICGERPYELKTESPAQLEHAILETEPRAPSRRSLSEVQAESRGATSRGLRKLLAPELDAIALRCLEKKPSARYLSVDAVLADVDRWLQGEAVLARTPGAWYRFGKFARRHRIAVGVGSLAILLLVAVATVAVLFALQAREESARASASRDFMLGLFKRADLEKARGADITARELLEAGRRDLLTRLESQPRLQAELLQGIATIQKDMGEYVGADSTYADAARIYGQIGLSREATLARIAEANVGVRMGNLKLAQAALQQALAIPNRPQGDAELDARTKEVEGWIAFIQGEKERSRQLFLDSHRAALTAFGPYHAKVMDALRGRIYAEQELKNFPAALQLLEQLEATAAKTSGVDAREMASLARDRADLLLFAGQFEQLLAHVEPALVHCVSNVGPNHADCNRLVIRKVNVMLRLGLDKLAIQDRPTLRAIADDQKSPALAADAVMLLLKLDSASLAAGSPSMSLERVVMLAHPRDGKGLGRYYQSRAMLALAEANLRMNRPKEAERWIEEEEAVQRLDGGSIPLTPLLALAQSLRGVAQMQEGRFDDAIETMRLAQANYTRLIGEDHPTTCLFALNQAIVLEAVARRKEALSIVQRVEPLLGRSMGTSAPAYLRAKQLKEKLDTRSVGDFREDDRSSKRKASILSTEEFFS